MNMFANNSATPNINDANPVQEESYAWGADKNNIQLGLHSSFDTIHREGMVWWDCALRNNGIEPAEIKISLSSQGQYLYSLEVFRSNEDKPFFEQNVVIRNPIHGLQPGQKTIPEPQIPINVCLGPGKYKSLSLAPIITDLNKLAEGSYLLRAKLFSKEGNALYYSDFVKLTVIR